MGDPSMSRIIALFGLVSLMGFGLAQGDAVAQIATNEAQKSPWDPPTRSAP